MAGHRLRQGGRTTRGFAGRRPLIDSGRVHGFPYRSIRPLGTGAVGDVHLCVDVGRRRLVVVKWLRAEVRPDSDVARRFRREAERMAQKPLPGVIEVEDYGIDDLGRTWMAMAFVDGASPSAVIEPGDAWACHRLLAGLAGSLDDLHGLGVVHRDLKPENILLRNDPPDGSGGWSPVLIDLGVAKWLELDAATRTGSVFGTPYYMSPEQFRDSKHVGPATDRYALAVVIYELLAGRLPFEGRSLPELLHQHLEIPPPALAVPTDDGARTSVPHLDAFMQRALAKAPHARYGSSAEMAEAFEAAARADGIFRPPQVPPPLFRPPEPPGVRIEVEGGAQATFDLRDGPVVIGRHEACQVPLDSPRLSRLHACVFAQGGRVWVADLYSQNGTRMGGTALHPGRPRVLDEGGEVVLELYDRRVRVERCSVDPVEPSEA
ncbi:MAG: FHA domain-containing protein [Deltaproteobacteria bacterium]|nr:MAG: FHA domain-containing protein [Deltaproteobacteria bacterium]